MGPAFRTDGLPIFDSWLCASLAWLSLLTLAARSCHFCPDCSSSDFSLGSGSPVPILAPVLLDSEAGKDVASSKRRGELLIALCMGLGDPTKDPPAIGDPPLTLP